MLTSTQEKYNKALRYEIFVKEEYGFAKSIIKKAECIFDIGGHIGYFSEWCREINKTAIIHFFEPLNSLFQLAIEKLNSDENIVFNNLGLASSNRNGIIFFNNEKTMQSSSYISFLNPRGTAQEAKFTTLASYIKNNKICSIDLIKMDIEGMEFEVFESFSKEEWEKIKNLIAEIHIIDPESRERRNNLKNILKKQYREITIKEQPYNDKVFLIRCKKE